jgi:hypothetical protein
MLADAHIARWQSKYGPECRDPQATDQQRSWLVNKIRTDIAMLNAHWQVTIKNLQNMHAKSLPRAHGSLRRRDSEREGDSTRSWNTSTRTGRACKAGDHTRADPKTA